MAWKRKVTIIMAGLATIAALAQTPAMGKRQTLVQTSESITKIPSVRTKQLVTVQSHKATWPKELVNKYLAFKDLVQELRFKTPLTTNDKARLNATLLQILQELFNLFSAKVEKLRKKNSKKEYDEVISIGKQFLIFAKHAKAVGLGKEVEKRVKFVNKELLSIQLAMKK